jgi:hypothetical protein
MDMFPDDIARRMKPLAVYHLPGVMPTTVCCKRHVSDEPLNTSLATLDQSAGATAVLTSAAVPPT